MRSHGVASTTGRQVASSTQNSSALFTKYNGKLRQDIRAFAGTLVVAPFVAAAANKTRSRKQHSSLLTVVAAVKPLSEFKESATYAKGKVQKASVYFLEKSHRH